MMWLIPNSWWSNTNVILADEMGLGKTIQTLAFVRSILHERPSSDFRYTLLYTMCRTDGVL